MKKFLLKLPFERIIISVIVLIAFAVVFVLLGRLKKKLIDKSNANDAKNKITRSVITLLRIVTVIFAFLVISQINGINIGSAIAGFGIISAVVGLALQDFLKDVIMGVHIISDKFYNIGDVVEYNGIEGVVVGFTVSATKIEALDDRSEITVCNRNISEIRKCSNNFYIDLPLPYNEDMGKISALCERTVKDIKSIPDVEKCVFEGTEAFDESSVRYRFLITCNPQEKLIIKRKALFKIQKALSDNGMAVPFNQLDVNINK